MNVLVIGAGKGIGLELVKYYLRNDHTVYAVSRNLNNLQEITTKGLNFCRVDIADSSGRADLEQWVMDIPVQLDVVVITAGLLIKKNWTELTEEDFHSLYTTNVFGVFDAVRRILPRIRRQGGHIVTIGSMGGVSGALKFPGMIFYSSSKAALSNLTECLAVELSDEGIHVNCLALGAVETDMKNAAFPEFKAPHTPYQMASFIGEFSVHHGAYFNGKTLPVSISTP